jgi:glycosyltransferase involved in cell wall biosynthesis
MVRPQVFNPISADEERLKQLSQAIVVMNGAVLIEKQESLAILGAYPPPIGGVTVHTRRLVAQLSSLGAKYRVYNLTSGSEMLPHVVSAAHNRIVSMLRVLLGGKHRHVLLMNRRLYVWALVAILGRVARKRTVLRLQGGDVFVWSQQNGWRWWFARKILLAFDGIVCVNSRQAELLTRNGLSPTKLLVMPGYLPPSQEELSEAIENEGLVSFCQDKSPLIVANGKFATHQGCDLYGFDLLLESLARLIQTAPKCGMVVALTEFTPHDRASFDRLNSKAKSLGIERNVFWVNPPSSLIAILKKADLFIRPTNTEGDSNSLREAIDLGVPSIASDVARRPPEAVLFENRNADDLVKKIEYVLSAAYQSPAMDQGPRKQAVLKYIGFLYGSSAGLTEAQDVRTPLG